MVDPLSCCAVKKREKPIDNISRGWYTENVQKTVLII